MEEWKIVCIFAVGHRDRYIGSLFRTSEPVTMILSTVDFRYDACGLWTTFRYQYPARVVGDTENVHETTLVGHEKGMKRAQKGHETTKKTSIIQDETNNCLQKNPYTTIKEKQETSAVEASVSCCHSCSHHRFAAVCE